MKNVIITIAFVLALTANAICQDKVSVTPNWTAKFSFGGILDQPRLMAANGEYFFISGNVGTASTIYAVMVKLDSQGKKLWQVTADTIYNGPSSSFTGIAATNDGGVIWVIDGLAASMPANSFQGLIKLDSNGNEMWRFSSGNLSAVQVTGDTIFVVTPGVTTGEVFILDKNGKILDQYTLPFAVLQPTFTIVGNYMYLTSKDWNHGYFANTSGYVAKLDWHTGQKIWSTEFPDIVNIYGTSDDSGNTYIAAGQIISSQSTVYPTIISYLMAKVDSSGKIAWQENLAPRKTVMANEMNFPYGIVISPDAKSIILYGIIQRGEGANDGQTDSYVFARSTVAGDSLWSLDLAYSNTIIDQYDGGVFMNGDLFLMGYSVFSLNGTPPSVGYITSYGIITPVVEPKPIPTEFRLSQNYPNPFNPTTSIQYQVASRQYVTLTVYNVLGERVATLVDGEKAPGSYTATFDGSKLPSGIYLYRLQAGSFTQTRKMVLVK